ncbi:hypothetical protein L1887_25323 [Cichorium endivia]|nr:hypothetical protein L1887_25323 [Cichorium endivia]
MAYNSVLLILFSALLTLTVAGRVITTTSSSDMVSDGVHDEHRGILRLNPFVSAEETESCRRSYGFMPCTTSIFGNLILLLIYNYFMKFAVSFLTSGSELLLHSLGTGVVGGVLVPIFGAAPQAIIILASGVFGSVKVAQDQVYIGMGLLAGSTVFLITLIWGDCLLNGKCDIVNSVAVDNQDTKPFDMIGSGVSTDIWTSYAAMIMTVSVVPLIVLQLPYIIPSTFGRNLSVLIGLVLSVSLLVAYCVYQVIQPKWQKRRLVFTKHKHVRARILMELSSRSVGGLLDVQDGPNLAVMSKLFDSIDVNGNKRLSQSELRALVVGLQLNDIKMNEDDAIDEVMKEFDTSNNNEIEFEEFAAGLQKWLQKAKDSKRGLYTPGTETMDYVHDYFEETLKEHYLVGDDDDVEEGGVDDPSLSSRKAVISLILGTLIAAAVAHPLVDAIYAFSTSTSISSYFIAFVILPWQMNGDEALVLIKFASGKKQRSASLTFSELYGIVTMYNLLCVSVLLAVIYVRGLTWDFSSEVLVILVVCIVIGLLGSLRTTLRLWTAYLGLGLYLLTLVLVYIVAHVFGWS